MVSNRPKQPDSDHDLLIAIRERLDVLASSVRENHAAMGMRLDNLQAQKANVSDLDPLRNFIEGVQSTAKERDADQVRRLDGQDGKITSLSRTMWIGVGILLTVQVLVVPFVLALLIRFVK